jgi:hypothetical protein
VTYFVAYTAWRDRTPGQRGGGVQKQVADAAALPVGPAHAAEEWSGMALCELQRRPGHAASGAGFRWVVITRQRRSIPVRQVDDRAGHGGAGVSIGQPVPVRRLDNPAPRRVERGWVASSSPAGPRAGSARAWTATVSASTRSPTVCPVRTAPLH